MPYYHVHRNTPKLTDEQNKLKEKFIATGAQWSPTWHNILLLDPAYFTAYTNLRNVPIKKQALSRKVQELIMLAMDASCTHLYEPGMRAHTANALKAGASKEEIMEALELTSVLSVHSLTVGLPLLQEVMQEKGQTMETDLTDKQQKLRDDFKQRRGYWNPMWDPVLSMSPEYFEAYLEFSAVPHVSGSHGHLDTKTKELIHTALDCAPTHLHQPSLKQHIRNAIENGATQEELMEVFQLATLMGAQTVQRGTDVLADELVANQKN